MDSCSQAQVIMLVEYIERRIDEKMKKLGIPEDKRLKIIMEVERIKQTLIEYGLAQLTKELGI